MTSPKPLPPVRRTPPRPTGAGAASPAPAPAPAPAARPRCDFEALFPEPTRVRLREVTFDLYPAPWPALRRAACSIGDVLAVFESLPAGAGPGGGLTPGQWADALFGSAGEMLSTSLGVSLWDLTGTDLEAPLRKACGDEIADAPIAWLNTLRADELGRLLMAVAEVNRDFFTQTIRPMVGPMLRGMQMAVATMATRPTMATDGPAGAPTEAPTPSPTGSGSDAESAAAAPETPPTKTAGTPTAGSSHA